MSPPRAPSRRLKLAERRCRQTQHHRMPSRPTGVRFFAGREASPDERRTSRVRTLRGAEPATTTSTARGSSAASDNAARTGGAAAAPPDEFDDADAPEDALVVVPPPPRAAKPAPEAKPIVERPPQPVVEPAPGIIVGTLEPGAVRRADERLHDARPVGGRDREVHEVPALPTATKPVPGRGARTPSSCAWARRRVRTRTRPGSPFVGAAGQLLTKILAAINLSREDVFICNVLKHRPPGNRNPIPHEVEACSPYLVRQLELIQPKVIVAFGTFAAQTLLDTKTPIGKLRGTGAPLPRHSAHRHLSPRRAAAQPGVEAPTWEDVQLARRVLDRATGA